MNKKNNKANAKAKKIPAPIKLTENELADVTFFLQMHSCLDWLWKEPKNDKAKALRQKFLVLLLKLREAFKAVQNGKTAVVLGKDLHGMDVLIDFNEWDDKDCMTDFVTPFFLVWIAKEIVLRCASDGEAKLLQRIKTLQDKVEAQAYIIEEYEKMISKASKKKGGKKISVQKKGKKR